MSMDKEWLDIFIMPYVYVMSGGHNDGIVCAVDHPGFKSGQATDDDDMRASPGHRCCITGPSV
jgi:hypothetical protein